MSKKRSISSKINLLDFPLPETSKTFSNSKLYSTDVQDVYFGERIKSELSSNSSTLTKSSHTSDILTSDDGLHDLISYKSSGSSTSGSEDLEVEATKKVSHEFEKLDTILYGEIENVSNEVHEYNQWKDNFPHLRVIGNAMKIHPSSEEAEDYVEEILAEHSDLDCTITDENPPNTKVKIKEAVINNVLKEVKSRLLNKNREPYQIFSVPDTSVSLKRRERRKSGNNLSVIKTDNNEMLKLSTSESFLQVSSVPAHNSPFQQTNFEYQSPIMKSHLSASKWQKDEFSSLPYISHSSVPYNNSGNMKRDSLSANKSEKNINNCSATSSKKSSTSTPKLHSRYAYSPSAKHVVLPPIQNLSLDGERSVSSTPRKFNIKPITNKLQKYSEEKSKTFLNFLEKN